MAFILYRFSDGHYEEIEVTEEFANEYALIEKETKREEWRYQWRSRKKLVSMDALAERGGQFESKNESAEDIIIRNEIKEGLRKIKSDYLTPSQIELLKLIYIQNKSLNELAKEFSVSYQAIQNRHTKILNRLRQFFN